ncbi:MAG: hypothetical protein EBR39_05730 [Betaproteobacteria bacterium]|jgi:hypothetical protein|nr:hypothetical protein [Betaproteobacteria bacterium]
MVFNGHTIQDIDALDEATMNDITVMYADGLVGNRSLLTMQGTLIAGVFNYLRASNSQPYTLKSVLGSAYEYFYGIEKADPSESLLMFMSQAPNFKMDRFKGK